MRNLDELRWEQFHIGDIFSVERPSARNKDNYEDGDVPFVASGAINNGVMKCCKPKDDEKLDKRECITVSPVDGSTFYQAYDFLGRGGAGSSVLLLRSAYNELLSGQFIARMISQTCSKYTYGHMGNKESIKREIIQLPTTDEYKPDYQYMASYSNQKRLALLEKYRVYAKTRIAELGEPMEIPAITQKKWEPVLVSDIFDILSGKRLVVADTTPGDRPFIGALDNNNGVARFVNDTNASLDKNVLGVNYNGNGMVIGFYHPYAPMITKKAVIPSGKQASFERNRNLFYVCCSRPKKRLIFFVTVPIDSTFKSFLVELVGEQNIFTFSQYIERKSIK